MHLAVKLEAACFTTTDCLASSTLLMTVKRVILVINMLRKQLPTLQANAEQLALMFCAGPG